MTIARRVAIQETDALPFILSYEEHAGGEHLEVEEVVEEEDVE